MPVTIANRPTQLDGCWKTWQETDVDVIARTDFESGDMRTRRRFTGARSLIKASVTLKVDLYDVFVDWWRINQRQGAYGTKVITPTGSEIDVQWTAPPQIQFGQPGDDTFTASVEMYRRV